MQPIRQAVILAAGRGVRLGELGGETPKGFLELGPLPIVAESIDRLQSVGIERIVVATGHLSELYDELAETRPGLVETIYNPHYAKSGSLHSLWCLRDAIDEDFLLLESDLIYERRALHAALGHPSPDVLLVSEPTAAGDEVWVETRAGLLHDMSKDRSRLGTEIAGELIGISKVSLPFLRAMLTVGERIFEKTLKADYELDGMVQAVRVRPMAVHLVRDLTWAEIDDQRHLERARRLVYPELQRRDPLSAPV